MLQECGLEREQCPLTYDNGASQCITGFKTDFVQLYPDGPRHRVIKGIAKRLDIEGKGIVEYTLTCDDHGTNVTIRASAYFVPALKSKRLISPQGLRTTDGNPCIFRNPTNDEDLDPESIPELFVMPKAKNWARCLPEKIAPARYHPLRWPLSCHPP